MEREKQKKAESERLERERRGAALVKGEDTTEETVEGNGFGKTMKRSKFASDEEPDSPERVERRPSPDLEMKQRKSRFDLREASPPPAPVLRQVFRTKEQILQAVMVDVRKILTQILMEVTTEEIQKAVEEVSRHFKKKAPATTLRKTQALTSLTGKLGLGIYESDSEDEESEPEPEKVTNDPDSDQEIKDRIERLRNDFLLTERKIEKEALEQEERERKQLQKDNRESSGEPEEQVHATRHRGTSNENRIEVRAQNSEESYREGSSHPESKPPETYIHHTEKHDTKSKECNSGSGGSSGVRLGRKVESSSSSSTSSSSSSDSSSSSSSSSKSSSPSPDRHRHSHQRRRSPVSRRRSRSRDRSWSRGRDRSRSRLRDRSRERSRGRRTSGRRRSSRDSRRRRRPRSSSSSPDRRRSFHHKRR